MTLPISGISKTLLHKMLVCKLRTWINRVRFVMRITWTNTQTTHLQDCKLLKQCPHPKPMNKFLKLCLDKALLGNKFGQFNDALRCSCMAQVKEVAEMSRPLLVGAAQDPSNRNADGFQQIKILNHLEGKKAVCTFAHHLWNSCWGQKSCCKSTGNPANRFHDLTGVSHHQCQGSCNWPTMHIQILLWLP